VRARSAVGTAHYAFDQRRRFTADASHELRTPLSVIRGIGEMGLGETRTPTEYKEVNTLLRLSQGDAAEERSQQLNLDHVRTGVTVAVDRLVLREAVTNIVDNAIKYGGRASTITIQVQAEGAQAVLSVADQGPGIAPEHRERIFDRFFRLDEARSQESGEPVSGWRSPGGPSR
jgi:signal transduction histidine kinase